ncbi:MAG: hypothetical protein R2941_03730 [Desulfobacterales bacterium]
MIHVQVIEPVINMILFFIVFWNCSSADGMAEQWEKGISTARDSLWEKLAEWISNAFEGVIAVIFPSIDSISEIF